jgi:hypothetical protein
MFIENHDQKETPVRDWSCHRDRSGSWRAGPLFSTIRPARSGAEPGETMLEELIQKAESEFERIQRLRGYL